MYKVKLKAEVGEEKNESKSVGRVQVKSTETIAKVNVKKLSLRKAEKETGFFKREKRRY